MIFWLKCLIGAGILLLLGILIAILLMLSWVSDERVVLHGTLVNISGLASEGRATAVVVKQAATEGYAVFHKEQVFWEDPKTVRSRELAVRSGDDIARLIADTHLAVQEFHETLVDVHGKTLPLANQLVATADASMDRLSSAAVDSLDGMTIATASANETIRHFDNVVKGPLWQATDRAKYMLDRGGALLDQGTLAFQIVNPRLPSMVASTDEILRNTAGITKEVDIGLHRLNTPLTFRQKVVTFLFDSGAKSLPVLIRR